MKIMFIIVLWAALSLGPALVWADDAVEPPVPVRTVPPHYPSSMKRDGTSGVVTVRCTIDTSGNVTEPTVVKTSNEAFSAPALEALSKWKFKPAKKGGTPVAIKVTFPIKFSADD